MNAEGHPTNLAVGPAHTSRLKDAANNGLTRQNVSGALIWVVAFCECMMAEFPDTTWAIPFALKERVYSSGSGLQVTVREGTERWPLDARMDLHDYATTFDWGRDSAGAIQLSLALLADALDNDARARFLHQKFKSRVIVDLPERWTLTRSRILAHAKLFERTEFGL